MTFQVYLVTDATSSSPHVTTVHRLDCFYMRRTTRTPVTLPDADTIVSALAINGPIDAHLCKSCFRSQYATAPP